MMLTLFYFWSKFVTVIDDHRFVRTQRAHRSALQVKTIQAKESAERRSGSGLDPKDLDPKDPKEKRFREAVGINPMLTCTTEGSSQLPRRRSVVLDQCCHCCFCCVCTYRLSSWRIKTMDLSTGTVIYTARIVSSM